MIKLCFSMLALCGASLSLSASAFSPVVADSPSVIAKERKNAVVGDETNGFKWYLSDTDWKGYRPTALGEWNVNALNSSNLILSWKADTCWYWWVDSFYYDLVADGDGNKVAKVRTDVNSPFVIKYASYSLSDIDSGSVVPPWVGVSVPFSLVALPYPQNNFRVCFDSPVWIGQLDIIENLAFPIYHEMLYCFVDDDSFYVSSFNVRSHVSAVASCFLSDGYNSYDWSATWDNGYADGYDEGIADGNASGYQRGYNQGYADGKKYAENSSASFPSLVALFGAIADVPITILNGLAGFSVWDIPIISILITLLFVFMVIWIIKRFI